MSAEDESKKDKSITANPAELPLAPDGSVDVDRIQLKVLILCKTKKTLDPVATYLIRRGWETVVTNNLKESFKIVTAFKPDFVLVSVNIPSPKLASLPTVLYQNFHAPVITFGEASDTRTMLALQTIHANYKMMGAISGPSLHRQIKQILQDIYKTEKGVESAPVIDDGSTAEQSTVAKAKPVKEKNVFKFSSDKKEPTGPGIIIAKGAETKKMTGVAYGGATYTTAHDESEAAKANVDIDALAAEFAGAEELQATSEGTEAKEMVAKQEAPAGAKHEALEPKGSGSYIVVLDPKDAALFEKTVNDEEALIQSLFGESKVNQALKVAALKSALPLEPSSPDISILEECTVIPIKILRKMAYLVVIVTGTVHDEVHYMSRFLKNLRHDLAANFEMVSVFDETRLGMRIDLEPIEGEDNTKGAFHFSLRTGRGLANMLLIYDTAFNATVYEEENSIKARINVNELVPDVPVGVDIYLHLPKNNRDHLYLKPASAISEEQKSRLLEKQAKLFVDRKDIVTYKGVVRRNKSLEARVIHTKRKKAA